ncbi:type II toxin-antitoxin system HicA family toxin [Lactobacillus sp. ESL0791]|uniref:type II toxin-antitoxin system HicA family toxin n=1 Tax=Lactobacillus sp. ESL0791 TaxID=2983234 RepID=UPI0023FA102B|nr:type II toxin-antitoxin system HicA family toxin [Lactobacillus sp. ESL0791]MDF7639954.1 type II toxin-antitoxin system HicA family toxin [Lactobacillus sp. ESL0791]
MAKLNSSSLAFMCIVVYNRNIKKGGTTNMPMTPREIIKLLKDNGWVEKRQHGTSHKIMFNPKLNKSIPVPTHSKELKKGTEQGILKQAGLK